MADPIVLPTRAQLLVTVNLTPAQTRLLTGNLVGELVQALVPAAQAGLAAAQGVADEAAQGEVTVELGPGTEGGILVLTGEPGERVAVARRRVVAAVNRLVAAAIVWDLLTSSQGWPWARRRRADGSAA